MNRRRVGAMRENKGINGGGKHAKVHLCCGFVQLFHVQVSPVSQVLCIRKDALTTIHVCTFSIDLQQIGPLKCLYIE